MESVFNYEEYSLLDSRSRVVPGNALVYAHNPHGEGMTVRKSCTAQPAREVS